VSAHIARIDACWPDLPHKASEPFAAIREKIVLPEGRSGL